MAHTASRYSTGDTGASERSNPNAAAAATEAMRTLWHDAGLVDLELRQITVQRRFDDFEDYWVAAMKAPALALSLAGKAPGTAQALKARMLARLSPGADGPVVVSARANAIKGRKPA